MRNMNSNFFFRKSGDVASSNVSEVESSESSESAEVVWDTMIFSGRWIALLPTHIWARPKNTICEVSNENQHLNGMLKLSDHLLSIILFLPICYLIQTLWNQLHHFGLHQILPRLVELKDCLLALELPQKFLEYCDKIR